MRANWVLLKFSFWCTMTAHPSLHQLRTQVILEWLYVNCWHLRKFLLQWTILEQRTWLNSGGVWVKSMKLKLPIQISLWSYLQKLIEQGWTFNCLSFWFLAGMYQSRHHFFQVILLENTCNRHQKCHAWMQDMSMWLLKKIRSSGKMIQHELNKVFLW
jgi:hypothetical protein